MYAQKEKPKENKSKTVANSVVQKKGIGKPMFEFVDNRPETVTQRIQQNAMNNSSKIVDNQEVPNLSDNRTQVNLQRKINQVEKDMKEHGDIDNPLELIEQRDTESKSTSSKEGVETGKETANNFNASGEQHALWVDLVGDNAIIMVASKPMTVPARLRAWSKLAGKMPASKLKSNVIQWIEKSWGKYNILSKAANPGDEVSVSTLKNQVHNAKNNLKTMIEKLFWAFNTDIDALGAASVYRGLHFTTDWEVKRHRSYENEIIRNLDNIRDEGAFSSGTYQLAIGAFKRDVPTVEQLQIANKAVMRDTDKMKRTTDFNRTDESAGGKNVRKKRDNFQRGIAQYEDDTSIAGKAKFDKLSKMLDEQETLDKSRYTSKNGTVFDNQYNAALSRFIDSQKTFESEMREDNTEYNTLSFDNIPFISTSKSAVEAVKYAQGKLASGDTKRSVGTLGRVLVYVAPITQMLEAGGIDVWNELGKGKLVFTDYRKNENEITFTGEISQNMLGGISSVEAGDSEGTSSGKAEVVAEKAAAPFGGLKPLPLNEDH